MRLIPVFGLVAAACAAVIAGASCSTDTVLRARCVSDQECIAQNDNNPNWRCEEELGECVCTDDLACTGEAEHCETYPGGDGRCHPNETCEWNGDCNAGFCDVQDRFCRLSGCTSDLQCDFGEVCDTLTTTCIPGCRSHGDCNLGDTCICTDGAGREVPCPPCDPADGDRSACTVGQCLPETCADKTFCKLGQVCEMPEEGQDELPACVSGYAPETPFCSNCRLDAGSSGRCGSEGPNFCLLDQSDPSGTTGFCGVDCSGDAGDDVCPNGFSCRDVLRLTSAPCQASTQCLPTEHAPDCESDADCAQYGAWCTKGGKCAGHCGINEGAQLGYCGCVLNEDCPTQTCGSDGRCSITRTFCVDDAECRSQILCVNDGGVGFCQIGRNCAPDQGITCADVREENPTGFGG